MPIGKSVLISGKGYVRISLTEEETDKAMEELLRFNVKELVRVNKFAKGSSISSDMNLNEMIRMLFEKQAMASFTYLQMKLDLKIEAEKKATAKD